MGNYVFKMPDIGEGIVEAEVVAWHVSPGDTVIEDAPLADVMTDKATVEITSPVAGTVVKTGCQAGEKMVIGADFVEFALAGEVPDSQSATQSLSSAVGSSAVADTATSTIKDAKHDQQAPVEVVGEQDSSMAANSDQTHIESVAPQESVSEALETPSTPSTKPKIRVVEDAVPPSEHVQSTPASTQTPATDQPPVAASADARLAPTAAKGNVAAAQLQQSSKVITLTPQRKIVPASPAVRRLARDLGIDLAVVAGSGRDGRVTKADIRRHCKLPEVGTSIDDNVPPAISDKSLGNSAEPVMISAERDDSDGPVQSVPVIGLRRVIAERMQEAKRHIPHFSYVEEVDVGQVEALRQQLNADRSGHQPKLSLLHFVLLAVSRSVGEWPQCNARYDDTNDVLQQYERVHLGVATMTPSGLMVPVVRNACQRDIWELAEEVNRLAAGARAGQLSRQELNGGTLTVTSLGALAGIATTPVINRPETSIIGPNKLMQRVELVDGQALNVSVMNISSSFDHRVVDGYDAACFVQEIRKNLQQPALLFI